MERIAFVPTSKQRREAARRHLERQLQQRQVHEAIRKRRVLIATIAGTLVLAIVVVIFVVALTGGGKNKPAAAGSTTATPSVSASASGATAAAYPCTWTKGGTAAKKASVPSTTTPPKTGTVVVNVATTQGPMVFTLDRAEAPCTVASFVSLVKQKYYDNTPCHRLTTAGIYVLQCGDPTGQGTGGPGYTVPDEATGKEKYPAGTIAMARSSAPNSGGSQFFIVYKDSPTLEQSLGKQQYTVFGKVTSGLSVVDKVAAKGSNNANGSGDGAPKLPISVETASVKSGG